MQAVMWEFLRQSLTKINQAKNSFLDFIFPKFCLGCKKEGDWICPVCQNKIVLVKTQICPSCGKISLQGRYCRECAEPESLSGIIAASYFEEGPIKELVHNFKYNHVLELGNFLGKIMAMAVQENLKVNLNFLIVPVPLHFFREKKRGYNQSAVLAEKISESLKLPYQNILLKKESTKRQVDLKLKDRLNNLKNVYCLKKSAKIKGKIIVLIDDISTTGTTLKECAKVLRQNGAKKVWGLVVARG